MQIHKNIWGLNRRERYGYYSIDINRWESRPKFIKIPFPDIAFVIDEISNKLNVVRNDTSLKEEWPGSQFEGQI